MKQVLFFFIVIVILFAVPKDSSAQWSAGGGFELREQEPSKGVSFKLQRDFLTAIPIIRLGIRGYGSIFPEQSSTFQGGNGAPTEFSVANVSYNTGAALMGGLNMGITNPYVGLGIGVHHFEVKTVQMNGEISRETNENIALHAIAGAEIALLPFIHPFIEYKFFQFRGRHGLEYDHTGSLSFGLMFKF